MRDILFRGKRIDNEEWVEGYFNKWPCVSWKELSCVIVPVIGLENGIAEQFIVDPTTVGQWTGLTDKNGKKIFEGDVVEVVRSGDETWRCVVSDIRYIPSKMCGSYVKSREVIGNIHDNELLKGD